MKPACARRTAGAVAGIALALVGCSGSNPVLPPGVPPLDSSFGGRTVQLGPDSSPPEAHLGPDVADFEAGSPVDGADGADGVVVKDAPNDAVLGIDLAPPPKVTVTILFPVATDSADAGPTEGEAADGGAAEGEAVDGGAPAPVIRSASRFAPKVSVEIESRGGDPTSEVLAQVKASLKTIKPVSTVVSATLNQTQFAVLPESGAKSYIFSDTPLDLAKLPSGFYTLQVDATTTGGIAASTSMTIYVDGGPSISFLQPADGAYVKGSVVVSVIVADNSAGVASVTFSVGQVELPPGAVTSSGGLYTATIDCGSFEPPLDGPQAVTVTAVNGNSNVSVATRKFTVDNDGPVISGTKPATGELIGKIATIEARVADPAGVMANSVVAVVAHGDLHFEVALTKGSDGAYRNVFDTTQLPEYAIFPTVSFRAQDVLGNQSAVGYLVSLDNTPPVLDLDPPANVRLFKKDGTCSWPFDPVGPDAVDDGSVVTQLFDVRARIEDRGNTPLTGTADFVPIAAIDPASVKVLILDDTTLPLVVDTSDPPDGICDDVNPELIPSVSPQSSKEAQLIDMVPMPANSGAGNFTPEWGSLCSGADANPPNPLCITTYSALKHEYLTYLLGYSGGGLPSIWTIGPIVGDSLQCAGRQFDASNNLNDGWACLAVEAADKLGNKQVSRPIRVCVAAKTDSKACTPVALGGATLASVTLPGSTSGSVSVVTSTPLAGAGGAPIQTGDQVIFSEVGPLAAALINGTHAVETSDSTTFLLTDLSIAPAVLSVVGLDGKLAVKGTVGLVLKDGALVHVTTTDATALGEGFVGSVLLSNVGSASAVGYAPANIQPTGFDLEGVSVKLSGGAIPLSVVPNCTGTAMKRAAGAGSTVDATRPCKPWRSFLTFEGRQL
jgi:hypothetical protein